MGEHIPSLPTPHECRELHGCYIPVTNGHRRPRRVLLDTLWNPYSAVFVRYCTDALGHLGKPMETICYLISPLFVVWIALDDIHACKRKRE